MGAVILMYDPSNYKKNKPMDLLSDIKMDYDDMGPYKISFKFRRVKAQPLVQNGNSSNLDSLLDLNVSPAKPTLEEEFGNPAESTDDFAETCDEDKTSGIDSSAEEEQKHVEDTIEFDQLCSATYYIH